MLYRQRNLIERDFCKIKHVRRIATRFDKLARNVLAAVTLALARLWLRADESRTYRRLVVDDSRLLEGALGWQSRFSG
jgi:hypothetical protein